MRQLSSAVAAAVLLASLGSTPALAQAPDQSPPYRDAAYVQVILGEQNAEDGLRLLSNFSNGTTEAVDLGGSKARRTVPCTGPAPAPPPAGQEDPCAEQFFYLDVADGYIFGGINTVELNISYLDQGFGPIYLDYDAIDPKQPYRQDPALARKRVELAQRSNTDAWKTVAVVPEDARMANGLNGADLRVGGPGVLTLRAVAAARVSSHMPPPPIRVLVDGKELAFTDAFPFIDQDRVLVPLRAIFEGVGATVQWDPATRTVIAGRGSRTVVLQIDNRMAYVGTTPTLLDVPPRLVEGRTFVPLRFASEALGLQVQWDGDSRTVTIVTPPPLPAPEAPSPPSQSSQQQP